MSSGTRVGTVIEEKYRLDKQIGRGSMGAVYRGTQLMVDRSVAIKLLHPTFAGHEQIQARFEVEAKAIARLNHPNCITLFDFGYSEVLDAFYTVVEFIDGVGLSELINQRPSVQRVVELVRQIASALGHAHHHGILHRDLKPENIMLATMTDGSEMVKVLDFGIAQIMKGNTDDDDVNEFESDRLTRVGEVFGTPPYMSPEQCESARDLSPATDLYSLGIIFYELLEGRLPFFAEAPVELMSMHINNDPPPMERTGIPDSLQDIVFQMLAKEPEERPESGNEIVQLLDAIPEQELSEQSPSIRTPGDARQHDPTMMSAPPDSDAVIVASDEMGAADSDTTDNDPFADLDPGEESEIYELKDLIAENPAPPQEVSAPEPEPDPARVETDLELSPSLVMETGDHEIQAVATQLDRQQKKMVAGVILAVILCFAGVAWIIIEYEPFSMADERELSSIAEYASSPAGSDENDSEPNDENAPSDSALAPSAHDDLQIYSVNNDEEQEGEGDAGVDEAGEEREEASIQEGESPPSRPPSPRSTEEQQQVQPLERPARQPPRLGVDDEEGESEPEEQRGPPRLGL